MNKLDPKTELAYKVMSWLNDNYESRHGREGLFNTPYGILELRFIKSQWHFTYHELEELPNEIRNDL